jgi:hypothetical protein
LSHGKEAPRWYSEVVRSLIIKEKVIREREDEREGEWKRVWRRGLEGRGGES